MAVLPCWLRSFDDAALLRYHAPKPSSSNDENDWSLHPNQVWKVLAPKTPEPSFTEKLQADWQRLLRETKRRTPSWLGFGFAWSEFIK